MERRRDTPIGDRSNALAMCDRPAVTAYGGSSGGSRPIAVDLFAGAGGMSLGFEQAGFDVVAAVEYDPVHAATHAYNFPYAEVLCRDVASLDAEAILQAAQRGFERMYPGRDWPGRLDAVIGGPPCQGFSTGGKREPGDERNSLLHSFVTLVAALQPTTVCLENVAGLLEERFASDRDHAFAVLRDAGYALSGTDSAVNCVDFGVPQRRRRVIVLGACGPIAPPRPAPVEGQVTVADALDGLPSPAMYGDLLSSDETWLERPDVDRRRSTASTYARELAGLIASDDLAFQRAPLDGRLTGARRTVHAAQTIERFSRTLPGTVEPKSRLYRLPLDGPARTLRAGTGAERGAHTSPRPIHPVEDRVITVREAARLHGYPDWFRMHTTNWHGHRQVGNSVPPPMARAAARALLESLVIVPEAPDRCVVPADPRLLQLSRTTAGHEFETVAGELPRNRTRAGPA